MQQQVQTAADGAVSTGRPGALIIGASSGMGAALARVLTARGYVVALIGRQSEKLNEVAREINDGGKGRATTYPHDVREYDAAPEVFSRVASDLAAAGATFRLAVYTAGVMPPETRGTWSFEDQRAMIETNVIGAIRWLDLAAASFQRAGGGTIAAISSVAGDRGRRGNSAYMASKAALSTYLESLRYRLHGTGVHVVTIKPGYVATPMTAGVKLPKPLTISSTLAAERIAAACERGTSVAYVPGYWRPIMWVIRALPASLMARLPI
ncbi:MAG TPA: SDR family NAD(P)-dependent oxidoreductase [Ktedonobacterales bacterium]|nr:SDR family NAD(P)-dependent oxidoreductase [Ktedonobacterales bacterium]